MLCLLLSEKSKEGNSTTSFGTRTKGTYSVPSRASTADFDKYVFPDNIYGVLLMAQ